MPPKRGSRGSARGGSSSNRGFGGRGRGLHSNQAPATSSSAATAGALSSSAEQVLAASQGPVESGAALTGEAVHTGNPKPRKLEKDPNSRKVIPFTGYETPSGAQSPATEPTPDNSAKPATTLQIRCSKKPNPASGKLDVDYVDTADSITSSTHSEPRFNRKAKPIWVAKTHINTTKFFGESPGPVPRVALMLKSGQGGTFAFGPKFLNKNSKGQIDWVLVDAAKKIGSTKVRHLRAAGDDVNFIGTSGCITCLGVYFEITGNRCFCAHINAWMGEDDWGDPINEEHPAYKDITKQVYERMKVHAKDHGWSWEDCIAKTIRFTCPHPQVLGFAVQDALKRFLKLTRRPLSLWQHGFMVLPGILDDQKHMQITYLGVKFENPNDPLKLLYDRLPNNFERRPYQDHNKKPMPIEWNYTAGEGWHVYHATGPKTYVRYPSTSTE